MHSAMTNLLERREIKLVLAIKQLYYKLTEILQTSQQKLATKIDLTTKKR